MKKYIYIIAAFVLCACAKVEQQLPDGEISFTMNYPAATKVTDSGFETGDAVSLYAVEYVGTEAQELQVSGNYFNNEKLVCGVGAWTGTRSLYWSDKACDFYALYPYQSSIGSVSAYPFEVAADQSGDGYEASDLLYALAEGVTRSDGAVKLDFKHMLSKVTVQVVKGEKFEGEIPDDIVAHIYNTNVECTVNLLTGSVEKNAFGAKKTITMKKLSNEKFEAVVLPQNLEKRTPLIELTMGGIAYLLEYSLSFRAGYSYVISVTLNTSPDQEQIEISIDPGVGSWE